MIYQAPVQDMMFLIEHLGDISRFAAIPALQEANAETARAVLEECARLNQNVLAPLNLAGDTEPPVFAQGSVKTTPGFKEAFAQYGTGGWQGLQHPEQFGGQALPKLIGAFCGEMLNAANMGFGVGALLTDGAIEALLTAGSDQLKATYLPKLISGEWTGTMNLTESQAGSDLSMVRSCAEPQGDGNFLIFGTKIFISWGEHDMAENIVHLVLARISGAPAGVKGISLFVVPKFLVGADGAIGERNDVHCVSLEHKMGIRSSPTAVMQYGDHGGARAFLVGEENRGLEYMFVMMNAARFGVGVQGVAIAERAYQSAAAYARERIQSRPVDGSTNAGVAIVHHPDVRRMLMTMRAGIQACRAMASAAAVAYDLAHHHPDDAVRVQNASLYAFLVPLVKGYSTEMGVEATSIGMQVHGGMGFIEEAGVAQYYRDARILTIYEGTTAIQANDLIGRKTLRDGGKTARAIAALIENTEIELATCHTVAAASVLKRLSVARLAFLDVVDFVLNRAAGAPNVVFAGSVPYLMLAGYVIAGWQMARALLVAERLLAEGTDVAFMRAKIDTARFYAEHILVRAPCLRDSIIDGADSTLALSTEAF